MTEHPDAKQIKAINDVSPSFCLAKWLQVTIDLEHGTNHSCHHPKRHPIPLEEIAKNPGALHNTSYKKEQRRLMLRGVRPPECSYCWDVEDCGSQYSDRMIKSTDSWAFGELQRIRSLPWDADVAPSYLEVMLDDRCNFSCMYCMADVSTGVAQEMKRHGPYSVSNPSHRMPSHPKPAGDNPFVAAFWKWLPGILPGLKVLRVTGGEPLLSPRFEEFLHFVSARENPQLTFVVNSHLGHNSARLDSFLARISKMRSASNFGKFELYTSLDTSGPQAEYIRHGLIYREYIRGIEKISAAIPGCPVVVMCTFNILSIGSFQLLLDEIARLKRVNPNLVLDISYLKNPEYLRAGLADPALLKKAEAALEKMKTLGTFSKHEIDKMGNVIALMVGEKSSRAKFTLRDQGDFFRFINEFDRRKNKKFLEIFPEYRDFYIGCKQAAFELAKGALIK